MTPAAKLLARSQLAALTRERDALRDVADTARLVAHNGSGWGMLREALARLDPEGEEGHLRRTRAALRVLVDGLDALTEPAAPMTGERDGERAQTKKTKAPWAVRSHRAFEVVAGSHRERISS